MLPRPLHPSLDALFAGRCSLADLDEYEATKDMPRLLPSLEDDDEPLAPLKFLGEHRTWRDVKCRCERSIAVVEWYGQDEPLAEWCLKCGRIRPRPYDARYPLNEADREAALPTVEVAMIAEPVA